MKKVLQKIKENKTICDIFFLLCVTFIITIPLYNKEFNVYYDEGANIFLRAYNSYKSILQNGNMNIINNFANGFGYSWSLFNGSLDMWIFVAISVLLNSFLIGFKVELFLIIFLSGLSMYKLIYEITENRYTSLIASCIYITSPYFFTDIFIRSSLNESMTFIFIPLVFLGLYNLFNTEKKHYYFVIGTIRINFNQ